MRPFVLDMPAFAFIVATRAALAAGVGLLVADRLPAARRRAIGRTLVAIGAATTLPAVMALRRSRRPAAALAFSRDRIDGFLP